MVLVPPLSRSYFRSLLLVAALSGCTSWQPSTVAPAQLLSDEHPESVRVTRTDGSRLRIYFPRIAGDSLLGVGVTNSQHLGVSLADIRELDTPKANAVGSVAVGVGVAALAVGIYVVAVLLPELAKSN